MEMVNASLDDRDQADKLIDDIPNEKVKERLRRFDSGKNEVPNKTIRQVSATSTESFDDSEDTENNFSYTGKSVSNNKNNIIRIT
eukprot:UN05389